MSITLRRYAERKNIPLQDVRIRLAHHRKNPEEGDAKSDDDRIDAIRGQIRLNGELDESQRRRMLEIAGRCWMHRTLSAGVTIQFRPWET